MQAARTTVKNASSLSPSCDALIEALLNLEVRSIQRIAAVKRTFGSKGIYELLLAKDNANDNLQKIDITNANTQYIGECIDAVYVLLFHGSSH